MIREFFFRFGIHLAQALTQKVIERGYTPFVVIRPENDASRNLYTKLGYRKAFETVRVTLQPYALKKSVEKVNDVRDSELFNKPNNQSFEGIRSEIIQTADANANAVVNDEGIQDNVE